MGESDLEEAREEEDSVEEGQLDDSEAAVLSFFFFLFFSQAIFLFSLSLFHFFVVPRCSLGTGRGNQSHRGAALSILDDFECLYLVVFARRQRRGGALFFCFCSCSFPRHTPFLF